MMKKILTITWLLVCSFCFPKNIHCQVPDLETAQWQADLDTLMSLIQTQHATPYWQNQKDFIGSEFAKLRNDLRKQTKSPEANLIPFFKLIALLKDGHSSIKGNDRYDLLGYLPFTTAWFDDSLYITKVHRDYPQALGKKIVAIGGIPIEAVMNKLQAIVPHANESRFIKFSPYYLHLPGLLAGLGVTKKVDEAVFSLMDTNGEIINVTFIHSHDDQAENFVSLIDQLKERPLYQQNEEQPYWFTYLPSDQILYLNYRRVTSSREEPISSFVKHLTDFVDQNPIRKFVVDIRDNGGGSGAYSAGLWKTIEIHPKINQAGKLFVITGYNTFSAAISFASYLELRTKAIFVGTTPCDYLNHPGDEETFLLPNSGIKVGLSSLFHESSFYQDRRPGLYPDIPISLSFQDFINGRDPIMDFIKEYKYQVPEGGNDLKEEWLGTYSFSPYQHLSIRRQNGEVYLRVKGKIKSPLYGQGPTLFATEIKDLKLQFFNDQIKLFYPDGQTRSLPKLHNPAPAPLDLLYSGRIEDAERAFMDLKREHPESQYWRDHSLSSLALETYMDFKARGKSEEGSTLAKNILQMAIRLNPEDHDFSEFSLRFY